MAEQLSSIVRRIALEALNAPGTIVEYMGNVDLCKTKFFVGQRFEVLGTEDTPFCKWLKLEGEQTGWNPRLFRKVEE